MKQTEVILIALIIMFCSSCSKVSPKENGVVFKFHPEKCYCCWGWDVKIGNDTIRVTDVIVENVVGFDFTSPVPVYIELGDKQEPCSTLEHRDYYDVKTIERIK